MLIKAGKAHAKRLRRKVKKSGWPHSGLGRVKLVASDGAMLLFHRDLGGEGRPPLVILHGLMGSSRNWQTTGRDLAAMFHVYAVDLRNHGGSPHADTTDYTAMVGDVLHWLDANHLSRVTLMGHSMGGKVAMTLACAHADRIERLIIVDIAPKTYASDGHRAEFAAMNALDLATLASRAEAEKHFADFVEDWMMRKFLATSLERDEQGRWRWLVNLPALTRGLAVIEANPLAGRDQYDGPVLFIAGEKSNYIEPSDRAVIREHFPQAQLVVIASSGHNPHMETREAFVRAVTEKTAT